MVSSPCGGAFKLNSDRSAIGNPGPLGIGGIIRDGLANCILSFSSPGFGSANEVELLALRTGLHQADRMGLSNFVAKGDSFCVASDSSKPPCRLADIVEEVLDLALRFLFPLCM